MTHEQRVAGFIAYLQEQSRLHPNQRQDYAKRIAIVENPLSGYNQPPLSAHPHAGIDPKDEALADIERQYWYEHSKEQQMQKDNT